ncbi:MAG: family 78 glycoside hydrolase catalytic domain [Kiritimatiellia bacterium]
MRLSSVFIVLSGICICGCNLLEFRNVAEVRAPVRLRVENLENPVGIDADKPRLSWLLEAVNGCQNLKQHSYQVLVADSAAQLSEDKGNLWDSGRVVSDQQFNIVYDGKPLASSRRCFWKVRVWTSEDSVASAWSDCSRWVTAVMQPQDWKACWIGPDKLTRPDYDLKGAGWIWKGNADKLENAPKGDSFFYALFDAPADVRERDMIMALTADDEYDVRINGVSAAKCWGHFNEWKWMRFIPVAKHLKPGLNHIAVKVSNREKGPSGLLLNIRDREISLVDSDASWKTSDKIGKEWYKAFSRFEGDGWKGVRVAGPPGCEPWEDLIRRYEIASPSFTKSFNVPADVSFAVLHITGLGFYEASLNGKRIGSKVLDPNPTRFDKRVLYSTYDLTDDLQQGQNSLNVLLGHGWYDMRSVSVWNFDNAPWRDFPRMIAQLEIVGKDGSIRTICSDNSWRQIAGPVGYDCIREGMVVGKAHPDAPDFNKHKIMAEEVPAPAGKLTASALPPTKVIHTLKPVKVTKLGEDRWMVDFGQNMAGWVDFKVKGQKKGDLITLLYGERINEDNSLDNRDISAHFRYPASTDLVKNGFFQKDHIFCDGRDGWVEYPHFVYHGFRYVEINGMKTRPDADNIVASVVCNDFKSAGHFRCSDELLNKLQDAALWAYRGNFVNGYPTDCPHREKNGWTGDASLASEMAMFNYDNIAAYEKWIDDLMDEQRPDGNLPGIVPTSGWGYKWGNGPAWDSALVIIPWMLYIYKGDVQILEKTYDSMKLYVDYMTGRSKDNLVYHGLGDWIPAKSKVPNHLTSSAYYYLDSMIVSRTAELLGKDGDAEKYAALAGKIKSAFNKKYYKGRGVYSIGTQTAMACALHQGIADADKVAPARQALAAKVIEDSCFPDFGILGSKYVFRALSNSGRSDLAYKMLTKTEKPSFGKWIVKDKATTLWEDWDQGSSRNHIMFGDFSAWMYQYLAGIRLSGDVCAVAQKSDPAKVAFKEFIIAPDIVKGLTDCSAEHESPYGTISSSWTLSDGVFELNVEVPVNTTATVYLPVQPGTDGIKSPVPETETDRNRAAFRLGSGCYTFSAPVVE